MKKHTKQPIRRKRGIKTQEQPFTMTEYKRSVIRIFEERADQLERIVNEMANNGDEIYGIGVSEGNEEMTLAGYVIANGANDIRNAASRLRQRVEMIKIKGWAGQ